MKIAGFLAATALTCSVAGLAHARDGQVTLTFYHTNLGFLAPLLDKFRQAHPEITIDDQAPAQNYAAGDQSVIRGLMTGSAPDVYLASYSSLASLAGTLKDRGETADLGPMITAEGPDWLSANYAPSLMGLGQVAGTQEAMPFTASLPLIYVNADLVQKAGGDMAHFPDSWDGVIALAQKISAEGNDVSGISFSVGGLSDDWYWQMMVMAAGGKMLNDAGTGIGYDNAAGLAALKVTQELAVKTGMTVYATPTPAQQQFFAGKVGMMVESPSDLVAYETAIGGRFDMRTERFPLTAKDGGLPAGGNALMILSQDKAKRQAAWEFVKFMTGAEAQAEVSKASGYMPTNKQAAATLAGFYADHPNFQTVFDSMDAALPWFAYPQDTGPEIWKGVAPVLDQLQRGKLSPEEALPKLKSTVAGVMAGM